MRVRHIAWVCIALIGSLCFAADYCPGEILVRFRADAPLSPSVFRTTLGVTELQGLPELGVRRYRVPGRWSVPSTLAWIRQIPDVDFAEPNYVVRSFETPNDPEFGPRQAYLRKIRSEQGWDLTKGSSEVVIAIIDTGVDLDHPDLVDKLLAGYDFHNDDAVPEDDNGHGTHVAGIAAASTNNGIGIAGTGWNCKILPLKALGSAGTGSILKVAAAVNYAATHGANVISMSLGTTSPSSTLLAAVQNAWSHNVVLIASAGNDGNSRVTYPASIAEVIAVGATTLADERSLISNFGDWVDVAAPGESIYSTYKGNGYRSMSGTSMSAPMVSGLAALLWSHLGLNNSAEIIRERIENNAIPVGDWLSHGRIDIERALLNLGPSVPVTRTAAPYHHFVEYGEVVFGNFASLISSEDDRLDLAAVRSGSGRRAHVWAGAIPEWSAQKLALGAKAEFSVSPSGLVKLSFWNWDLLRWDVQKTWSVGSADRTFQVETADVDPYVGPNGEVRLQVARTESRNRLFRLRVDKVEFYSISSN